MSKKKSSQTHKKIKIVFEDIPFDEEALSVYIEGDIDGLEKDETLQTTSEYYSAIMFQLVLDTLRDLGVVEKFKGPDNEQVH